MEDNLNISINGRRKNFHREDYLNFFSMQDNLNLFSNERLPHFFQKEDDLIFFKWKTTSFSFK